MYHARQHDKVHGYFGVLATDGSRAALAVGRQAVYHQRKLTEVDRTLLERYFTPVDGELMRVREALRERVCFAHQNVLELGKAAMGLMDIVVCQNVLIYFDRDRRIEILDSLLQFLSPGGLIVLGSGEILAWSNPQVERVPREDTLAFRRLPS